MPKTSPFSPQDYLNERMSDLNGRALDVMREIVLSYLNDGAPVGSRTLSRLPNIAVSAATVRNIMADLEDMGFLQSLHTSSGRVPTETGLRLFVDGIMQMGDFLQQEEREQIETLCSHKNLSFDATLRQASLALSGLSGYAALVAAPKRNAALKHIEFIPLENNRALAIMVSEDGQVENRAFELPLGTMRHTLTTAANYLNAKLAKKKDQAQADQQSLLGIKQVMRQELEGNREELDQAAQRLVELGLAMSSPKHNLSDSQGHLIVRGQSNLLNDVEDNQDLRRIRELLTSLEQQETYLRLIEAADSAQGVKIFIGSQTELFGLSGCSMVIKPYRNTANNIIGAVGVIGPMRLNYGKVIPLIDYTADVMSRLLR